VNKSIVNKSIVNKSITYKWRFDLSIIRGAACNHVSQVEQALQNAEASYEVPFSDPLQPKP
jgi:hypothetical protein